MKQNESALHWLKDAAFYQIFPPAFYDTNGDGIGDIAGIRAKLDYIRDLGCNALRLMPVFHSSFRNAGWDVCDFYRVSDRYGTNEELKQLFEAVHERDMRVVLDFVPGYTSIHHPWFKKSALSDENQYSNWYIWTSDYREAECEGLNLIAGGGERSGNYSCCFFYFQAELNYGFARPDPDRPWQLPVDHPDVLAVHAEMRKIMRYWLHLGADGFYISSPDALVKGDPGGVKTYEYWRGIRDMFDREYPYAVLLGEWGNLKEAVFAGFHGNAPRPYGSVDYASLFRSRHPGKRKKAPAGGPYFSLDGRGDITAFLTPALETAKETAGKGYYLLPTGNADLSRLEEGRNCRELKTALAFVFTHASVPLLYYGDEIGMRNSKGLSSKEGSYGRSAARTPMQWDASNSAGFSDAGAERLYLPVDTAEPVPHVESGKADEDSLLWLCKILLKLRRLHPALSAQGELYPLYVEAGRYPLIYLRRSDEERILVALNPTDSEQKGRFSLSRYRGFGISMNWKNAVKLLEVGSIDILVSSEAAQVTMASVSCAVIKV
jgi:maltose alpha-D-glucosyltransferase/alpha-amylase